MNKAIRNIVEPLARRVGTMCAGALIGYGLTVDYGPEIEVVVTTVFLIAIDVILSFMDKRKKGHL